MLGYTPHIVAFIGKAGSGKTTAANWTIRNHGRAVRISFASPLKKMFYELLREAAPKGWPNSPKEYMDGALKEAPIEYLGGHTARYLMQTLGTGWGRNTLGEDFWTQITAGKLERMLSNSRSVSDTPTIKAVIDDVRFENEAQTVRDFGGALVRVIRPDAAVTDAQSEAHASETQQDGIEADVTLVNDGDIADLEAKLATLLPPPPKKS